MVGNPDMQLDNYAEAATTIGEVASVTSEGLSVWARYSGNGINGNYAWFSYYHGNIDVKNPDNEITGKMLEIATKLGAKVQGDDGEIYELTLANEIRFAHTKTSGDEKTQNQKPWRKFW